MKYLFTFLLLLLTNFSFAQDMQRVKAHIDTLTSPEMHGRGYVHNGDKKAASYLADYFKKTGLSSFQDSYIQEFNMNINTFPDKLHLKTGKKCLVPGKDYILAPYSGAGSGSGKWIELDTAIFNNQEARAAFMEQKLHNKVMSYSRKNASAINKLPAEVQKKLWESKALVEIQEPKDKLTAYLADFQYPLPVFKVKKEALPEPVKKASFAVDSKLITNYTSQNVIAKITGKTQPDSFIVVTAHYDHLGRMGEVVYFPGANDNASGISMMLELAAYYAEPENQPDYSMAFMAFGAEEAGLIGSKYYTEHPLFPLQNIRFLINLDLLGTGDDGMMAVNGAVLEKEFQLLEKINQQNNYLPAIKKRGKAANSDHYFFSEKGVPAFFFYTLGGIAAYHDVDDRAETLPLTRYREVYQLLKDFIKALQ